MSRNLLPPDIGAEDWLTANSAVDSDTEFTFAEDFSFRVDLIPSTRIFGADAAVVVDDGLFGVGANPIVASDRALATDTGDVVVAISADDFGSGGEFDYVNAAFGDDSAVAFDDGGVAVDAPRAIPVFASDRAFATDAGSRDMPSWDAFGPWVLRFEDDFLNALDTSVWQPNWLGSNDVSITPPVSTSEQACYDPAQVSVANSVLHLTAMPESTVVAGNVYPYRSGMINSLGTEAFNCTTTGQLAVEASINLSGPGDGTIYNFPTFRLYSLHWPTTGEVDIIAGVNGAATYDWRGPDTGNGVGGTPPGDYTGWHTYGMVLTSTTVSFYYDGTLVGSVATNASGVSWSPSFLYLILNHGIAGGDMPQATDMMVDWVRVWE